MLPLRRPRLTRNRPGSSRPRAAGVAALGALLLLRTLLSTAVWTSTWKDPELADRLRTAGLGESDLTQEADRAKVKRFQEAFRPAKNARQG